MAFCGVALQGPRVFPVQLGRLDEAIARRPRSDRSDRIQSVMPADLPSRADRGSVRHRKGVSPPRDDARSLALPVTYVTAMDARQMVCGAVGSSVPLHQACVLNLGRFLGRMGLGMSPESRVQGAEADPDGD